MYIERLRWPLSVFFHSQLIYCIRQRNDQDGRYGIHLWLPNRLHGFVSSFLAQRVRTLHEPFFDPCWCRYAVALESDNNNFEARRVNILKLANAPVICGDTTFVRSIQYWRGTLAIDDIVYPIFHICAQLLPQKQYVIPWHQWGKVLGDLLNWFGVSLNSSNWPCFEVSDPFGNNEGR